MPSIRPPVRVAAALGFVASLSLTLAWPVLRSTQKKDSHSRLVDYRFQGEVLLSLGSRSDTGYDCGGIFAFDLDDRSFHRVSDQCDWSEARWSNDYRALLAAARRKLFVVKPAEGVQRQLTNPQGKHYDDFFGWSPDGQSVTFERLGASARYTNRDFRVGVWTKHERRIRVPWFADHPILSPDTSTVAFNTLQTKGGTLVVDVPEVLYRDKWLESAIDQTPPVRPRTPEGEPVHEWVSLFYEMEWSPDSRWDLLRCRHDPERRIRRRRLLPIRHRDRNHDSFRVGNAKGLGPEMASCF